MRELKITKSITNRETLSVEKYLQEIASEELITVEQEVELAKRIKEGDDKAVEKLVRANLRFVVSVAKQYQNQGLPLPDLINEGNLGLLKAAEKFDETKGFKFISYAVWWIRQSILQALAEQSRIVRLPLNKLGSINKVNRAVSKFMDQEGRAPSNEEIAKELHMDEYQVESALRISGRHISMDAASSQDVNNLYEVMEDHDSPSPDHEEMGRSLRQEVLRATQILSENEKTVITKYFGIACREERLEEIGKGMGLSRERTRQIKEKAIKKIRRSPLRKILMSYL